MAISTDLERRHQVWAGQHWQCEWPAGSSVEYHQCGGDTALVSLPGVYTQYTIIFQFWSKMEYKVKTSHLHVFGSSLKHTLIGSYHLWEVDIY